MGIKVGKVGEGAMSGAISSLSVVAGTICWGVSSVFISSSGTESLRLVGCISSISDVIALLGPEWMPRPAFFVV